MALLSIPAGRINATNQNKPKIIPSAGSGPLVTPVRALRAARSRDPHIRQRGSLFPYAHQSRRLAPSVRTFHQPARALCSHIKPCGSRPLFAYPIVRLAPMPPTHRVDRLAHSTRTIPILRLAPTTRTTLQTTRSRFTKYPGVSARSRVTAPSIPSARSRISNSRLAGSRVHDAHHGRRLAPVFRTSLRIGSRAGSAHQFDRLAHCLPYVRLIGSRPNDAPHRRRLALILRTSCMPARSLCSHIRPGDSLRFCNHHSPRLAH